MDKEIQKKAKSGAIWTVASNLFLVFVRIGIISVLARLINPSEFGLFATFIIFYEVSKIGFQTFLTKNVILNKKENSFLTAAITISLIHGIVISAIIILSAEYISYYFEMENLENLLRYGSILVIVSAISTVWNALVEKDINYKWLAKRKTITTIIGTGVVAIILAYFGFGFWALFIGLLVNEVLDACLVIIFKPIKFQKFNLSIVKEVYRDFTNITLTNLLNKFATKGDYFIVSKFLGEASLGFYSKAYQIMSMPTNLVGQTLNKIGFSSLANYQNDYDLQKKTYLRLTYLVAIILLPASVLMYYLSDKIILFLLGKQWTESIAPFQILVLGTFFRLAYKIPATLIQVQRRFKTIMFTQLIYAVSILGISYLLKDFGITGIAFGVLFSLFCQYIILNFYFIRSIKISLSEILNSLKNAFFISISLFLIIEYFTYAYSNLSFTSQIFSYIVVILFILYVVWKHLNWIMGENWKYWMNKFIQKENINK